MFFLTYQTSAAPKIQIDCRGVRVNYILFLALLLIGLGCDDEQVNVPNRQGGMAVPIGGDMAPSGGNAGGSDGGYIGGDPGGIGGAEGGGSGW